MAGVPIAVIFWQRVREAYGATLLRWWSRKGPGGSNPPAVVKDICSAIIRYYGKNIIEDFTSWFLRGLSEVIKRNLKNMSCLQAESWANAPSSDAFRR